MKAWFGMEYDKVPATWSKIFTKMSSNKFQERIAESTTFGLAPTKTEAAPIQYDSDQEGYVAIFQHAVYGLGYIVTREELEDNQYEEVSQARSGNLAWSMQTTAEYVHANVLNRGFSTQYPIGDGAALFSAAHPTQSGNQSNLLTAADFSEAAMEDATKAVWAIKNNRGFPINAGVKRLIIPTNVAFNATRVLNSVLRSGTNNNDINALNAMGIVPDIVVNKYLSSSNAWYVQTDVPNGLISMWRRQVELEKDNDFDTENAKAKATMRFACGAADWRAIFGNASASG
ncbi:hypothetical protein D9601_02445 [Sphingomonas sp. MA1305]|nr:hypothetical protein [Sphingomonas sp. MA1305]